MTLRQAAFWVLIVAVLIHVGASLKKASDQVTAKVSPSGTDWLYYLASAGLVFGVAVNWRALK